MYLSSVFDLNLPFITHGEFGFYMSLLIVATFIVFNKTLIKKFKHYLNLNKGSKYLKLHKLSVIFLMVHFVGAVASGILMRFYNTYSFHSLSRFIVPVLILFHLMTKLYAKRKLSNP
jgi:hypothetical protein